MIQRADSTDSERMVAKIAEAISRKLAGDMVEIELPRGIEFEAGGSQQIWGYLARQCHQLQDPEDVRQVVESIIHDFPEQKAAVLELLENPQASEPICLNEAFFETDLARGQVLGQIFKGRVRYLSEWSREPFLFWDGRVWQRDSAAVEELAKRELPQALNRILDEEAAIPACNRTGIQAAIWYARTMPGIATRSCELDQNPWLFNMKNGTYDLTSGKLLPHDPDHLITKISPTVFDPSAGCPNFLATLDRFVPDRETQVFLQTHFGSMLSGFIGHLFLPILFGDGSNGKSTIVNAIMFSIGEDFAMSLDPAIVTSDGSKWEKSDQSYHLAALNGKRMLVLNELQEASGLRAPMMKRLISSDPIAARRPYEMPINFKPSHKAIMLTNHLPKIQSHDSGTSRRLALVKFDVQIAENQDNKAYGKVLESESSGIFNWLLAGFVRWREAGFNVEIPEKIRVATQSYFRAEDIVGQFVEQNLEQSLNDTVTAKAVYERYQWWCSETGREVLSQTMFGRKISTIPWLLKEKKGVFGYLGARLKPLENLDESWAGMCDG